MSRLVCIDTMICVWGVKKTAHPGQEQMIKKTEALLKLLDEEKDNVIIPSPVITELLCPVPSEERRKIMGLIAASFMVVPLDTMAAIKAGEIWHEHKDSWKDIYETEGESGIKNRFKFDTLIVGIAITRKVNCIYSNDSRLRALCGKHITALDIPDIPIQTNLFGNI